MNPIVMAILIWLALLIGALILWLPRSVIGRLDARIAKLERTLDQHGIYEQ